MLHRFPSQLSLFLLIASVFLICLLTSLSGLLSKREISTKVTPLNFASAPALEVSNSGAAHLSLKRPLVDQVVLVLVDALRPDFVFNELEPFIREGNHECQAKERAQTQPMCTRPTLSALRGSLTDYPQDTLATFLIADAPTTTSQRLKAIMTGTIPAFIEGGANFNSDEVIEDNLILQLSRARQYALGHRGDASLTPNCPEGTCPEGDSTATTTSTRPEKAHAAATVLGDDTWLTLFNSVLWREHIVFPSFDVRDLDSNDEGVMRNVEKVLSERVIKRSQGEGIEPRPSGNLPEGPNIDIVVASPLVILHFLGIDHAGHSFNAYHSEMERKITDINAHLQAIMTLLQRRADATDTNTALIVMGDHGMTNSGDHGGDFSQETDTLALTRIFRRANDRNATEEEGSLPAASIRSKNFIDLQWAACASDRTGKNGRDPHPTCRFHQCASQIADANVASRTGAAYQIDIVPTLAALLGVGIPYSNLGSIIPEIIALAGDAVLGSRVLEEAERNVKQMNTYLGLDETVTNSGALGKGDLEQYIPLVSANDGISVTNLRILALLRQMAKISGDVRRSRAQMKVERIFIGAMAANLWGAVVLAALTFRGKELLANLQKRSASKVGLVIALGVLLPATGAGILLDRTELTLMATFVALLVGIWAIVALALKGHKGTTAPSSLNSSHRKRPHRHFLVLAAVTTVIIIRIIPPFSNSFVVFEDSALLWLLGLTIVVGLVATPRDNSAERTKQGSYISSTHISAIALLAILRFLSCGIRQRRHHTHTIAALSPLDNYLLLSYGWDGNLKGGTGGSSALDVLYFTLDEYHDGAASGWRINHFAAGQLGIRFAFNMVCIGGLLLGHKKRPAVGLSPTLTAMALALAISLFEHIPTVHHLGMLGLALALWLLAKNDERVSNLVSIACLCGWTATLSTTPSARLVASLAPLVVRLGAAVSRPFMGAQPVSVQGFPHLLFPSILLHLVAWCLFFASGQQTVISTLDWGAAFVGVEGFKFIVCGALVAMRTFYPFILSLVLPVALWSGTLVSAIEKHEKTAHASVKEIFSGYGIQSAPLATFLFGSFACYSLAASASCLATGILRMHLMMWAIFCPKMLYDVIIWALMGVVIGLILVLSKMSTSSKVATKGAE